MGGKRSKKQAVYEVVYAWKNKGAGRWRETLNGRESERECGREQKLKKAREMLSVFAWERYKASGPFGPFDPASPRFTMHRSNCSERRSSSRTLTLVKGGLTVPMNRGN